MNIISNIRNKKYRNQTTMLLILLICGIIFIYGYQLKETRNSEILENEWQTIELAFDKAYREAIDMNATAITNIEIEVEEQYKNDQEKLESDLMTFSEINDLTNIFNEQAIQGKYLFGITNDNNDPFIMSSNKIELDSSANCSAGVGSSRSFDVEINKAGGSGHFNKILAQKAINDLIDGNHKYEIWSYLSVDESLPWYDDIKNLTYVDMEVLKDLFFKYDGDIRVLQSFEILVPSYIYRDEDLIGNRLTTINGFENENYQLILVQGFNLCDVLDAMDYKDVLNINYSNLSYFNTMINIAMLGIVGFMILYFTIVGTKTNKDNNIIEK